MAYLFLSFFIFKYKAFVLFFTILWWYSIVNYCLLILNFHLLVVCYIVVCSALMYCAHALLLLIAIQQQLIINYQLYKIQSLMMFVQLVVLLLLSWVDLLLLLEDHWFPKISKIHLIKTHLKQFNHWFLWKSYLFRKFKINELLCFFILR